MVAFLGVRADVQEAMAAGYALKTIWEHLHETGKIPYRYETFLKHVRQHITTDTSVGIKPRPIQPMSSTAQVQVKKPPSSKAEAPPPIGVFNFNPKPNKEDLL